MRNSPTESGPFQKYLFSSDCYVRLGEYYARLVTLRQPNTASSKQESVQRQFAGIWQEIFDHNLAFTNLLRQSPWASQHAALGQVIHQYEEQVRVLGEQSVQLLVEQVMTESYPIPNFPIFFDAWVEHCDNAWNRLVRTESFAEMIGQIANGCIDHLTPEQGA